MTLEDGIKIFLVTINDMNDEPYFFALCNRAGDSKNFQTDLWQKQKSSLRSISKLFLSKLFEKNLNCRRIPALPVVAFQIFVGIG